MKISKFIIWILVIALLFSFYALIDIFYFSISNSKLDSIQQATILQINKKWDDYLNQLPLEKQGLVSENELMDELNFYQKHLVEKIFRIDPKTLGFKGPFFTKEIPDNLIRIEPAEINNPDDVDIGINFLPEPVFDDFQRMNEQMKKDIDKELYVESGYRSPGFQAYLFLYYLPENGYSLSENAKWLTMPGYSEHNSLDTAIDFINHDGINGDAKEQTAEDFVKLPEYDWLNKNANKYNFYLSYPIDNPYGISFEPWHWHWERK
jgi:hypothetical protein